VHKKRATTNERTVDDDTIPSVDVETAGAIDRLGDRIDSLGAEVADLRAALHEGLEENRRYALMLNEHTRDDVRLVAEGVAALAVKIDSLRR
jgi:regulator of replication initiation timing